jgi:FAD/FMN-containing dehydrogenase
MSLSGLTTELQSILGEAHITEQDCRVRIRPGSTSELALCLAALNETGTKVTVLGGGTGLVGGTSADNSAVILSTERLTELSAVDKERRVVTAGAGVTLQHLQNLAQDSDMRMGLDLGARGSCTIGGNVSTNAGGINVIRYGMIRRDIRGLEVVLANGTVLSDLGGLEKNNAGYDLKQLFIGSEGTLGVVAAVTIALHPAPHGQCLLLLGFDAFAPMYAAAQRFLSRFPGRISALEVMWRAYYDACSRGLAITAPIGAAEVYLIVQVDLDDFDKGPVEAFASTLDDVVDGCIAQSARQEENIWAIRDGSEVIERAHPIVHSYDVSLRPQSLAIYVDEITTAIRRNFTDTQIYFFGHLGDGNIHVMIGLDDASAIAKSRLDEAVYGPLTNLTPSSISAEHGIGIEKAPHLWRSRSDNEIATMNTVRRALDPKSILNPHIIYAPRSAWLTPI